MIDQIETVSDKEEDKYEDSWGNIARPILKGKAVIDVNSKELKLILNKFKQNNYKNNEKNSKFLPK